MNAPPTGAAPPVALVTGACSGIGLALAHELASRGYGIALASQRAEPLEAAASALRAQHGAPTWTFCVDLAREGAAQELFDRVLERGLTVEVLVNNAGFFFFGEVADADPARANAMLQLHVVTPSLLCTLFGREMRARRSGKILLVSSISAWRDFPGIAYYGSSKKYLRGFARALRSELGVYGVGVTCLAPGATATELYAQTSTPVERARRLGVMMDAQRVAREGVRALLAGEAECVPGLSNRLFARAAALTPQPVVDLLRAHAPWLPGRDR